MPVLEAVVGCRAEHLFANSELLAVGEALERWGVHDLHNKRGHLHLRMLSSGPSHNLCGWDARPPASTSGRGRGGQHWRQKRETHLSVDAVVQMLLLLARRDVAVEHQDGILGKLQLVAVVIRVQLCHLRALRQSEEFLPCCDSISSRDPLHIFAGLAGPASLPVLHTHPLFRSPSPLLVNHMAVQGALCVRCHPSAPAVPHPPVSQASSRTVSRRASGE